MKRLMKSMVLMAAAALALASCAKENVNEPNNGTQKFAEVSFKAEIPAYQTTKSTIDVDGLTFNTRWAEGDQMGMSYSYGETGSKTEKENVPAKYSKDGSYTVSLPTQYTGRWDYYVYYPYQSDLTTAKSVEIPFGPERTQTGNVINPAYDIMYGIDGAKNAAAGKNTDGTSIHFEMERLTSMLYFHFTSSLNEKVLKATLSVEGDPIAADKYVMHVDMTNAATSYTTGSTSNEITLNISDATAEDLSLWFNILPYEKNVRENGIKNIKLIVETETKTFSITNPNTTDEHYEAGQIHSITANVPDSAWKDKTTPEENKVFFYESFDKNDGTGGNDNQWSGTIASSDAKYDKTGWSGTSVSGANQCIKLGTGSVLGSITSPALGITSNIAKISFKAAAWNSNSEKTTLYVSISGSGSIDTKSVTLVKGAWTEYTCTISGADKDTKVTFAASTAKNNRFFLDEVYVYTGEKPSKPVTPTLTLSKESASVEASATTTSFDVQSNTDWSVTTDADWIKGYDKDGKENGTVTIQFDANTTDAARTATFTVKTADNAISKTFTLTQKAFGAEEPTTETFTFSQFTSAKNVTFNSTNFTIKMSVGTGSTNPAWASSQARLYAKGSLAISSTRKISNVSFNYDINANKNGNKPTIDSVKGKTNAGSWDADSKTWSDATGDTEITMLTSGSAGNLGFTSITVTFAE